MNPAGKESSMNPYVFAILALALLSFKPTASLSATKLTIGHFNVQRMLKTQNPRVGEVNIDDLVDNRFIRKLDESGFFERIYGK